MIPELAIGVVSFVVAVACIASGYIGWTLGYVAGRRAERDAARAARIAIPAIASIERACSIEVERISDPLTEWERRAIRVALRRALPTAPIGEIV